MLQHFIYSRTQGFNAKLSSSISRREKFTSSLFKMRLVCPVQWRLGRGEGRGGGNALNFGLSENFVLVAKCSSKMQNLGPYFDKILRQN